MWGKRFELNVNVEFQQTYVDTVKLGTACLK